MYSAEDMYSKKQWDKNILISGGISFYYPVDKIGEDTVSLCKRYRVAMTYKGKFDEEQHTKKLKYRVRTASGNIFSVASKTQSEAQAIIDEIFGAKQYRVSQMME